MLTREALQAHIAAGQPFLFHVTSAENVEAIKREGLRPGSELGKSTRDDFFRTRPGHVYLIRQLDLPIVEVGPKPRVFRIDLDQLDPDLIDPDEDMVSEMFSDAVPEKAPRRVRRTEQRTAGTGGEAGCVGRIGTGFRFTRAGRAIA
jgi:hypothetical protein